MHDRDLYGLLGHGVVERGGFGGVDGALHWGGWGGLGRGVGELAGWRVGGWRVGGGLGGVAGYRGYYLGVG